MLCSLLLDDAIPQYLVSHKLLRLFIWGFQLVLSEKIFQFIFQGLFFLITRFRYQLSFLIYSFILLLPSSFLPLSVFHCERRAVIGL